MLVLMASAFSAVLPSADLLTVDPSPVNHHPVDMRRRQQRIAEITEMIHVASLLHDDVIDNAETRRGMKALNSAMGNKIAILAGDFLLARASVSLASLRNTEVIELLSQVIEHLVSGEILQVTQQFPPECSFVSQVKHLLPVLFVELGAYFRVVFSMHPPDSLS